MLIKIKEFYICSFVCEIREKTSEANLLPSWKLCRWTSFSASNWGHLFKRQHGNNYVECSNCIWSLTQYFPSFGGSCFYFVVKTWKMFAFYINTFHLCLKIETEVTDQDLKISSIFSRINGCVFFSWDKRKHKIVLLQIITDVGFST